MGTEYASGFHYNALNCIPYPNLPLSLGIEKHSQKRLTEPDNISLYSINNKIKRVACHSTVYCRLAEALQ